MSTWARSNKAGDILEIRHFAESEWEPVSIPHKDVIWRPVEVQSVAHDPETEELNVRYEGHGDVVREIHSTVGKDIEELRKQVLEGLRQLYHGRILDAMPDMNAVGVVCVDRDIAYAVAKKEMDYAQLKGLFNA